MAGRGGPAHLAAALFLAVSGAQAASYGIVLDCGSTGTRVNIFYWEDPGGAVSQFTPTDELDEAALKASPGISSFSESPELLTDYFRPLLEQAARWVPAVLIPNTRVRALATAGMRLLSSTDQSAIWAGVQAAISNSSFAFEHGDAMTISGGYEGIFGWLSLRAILGVTGDEIGSLDLGGASTQITFPPPNGNILASAYEIGQVSGGYERIYSQSYMRFGQDQALLRAAELLVEDSGGLGTASMANPCFNAGYAVNLSVCSAGGCALRPFHGAPNHSACVALTARLLHRDYECLMPPCAVLGTYQPAVTRATRFYAYSAYVKEA